MFFILPIIFELFSFGIVIFIIATIVRRIKSRKNNDNSSTHSEPKPFQNTISNANNENDYWNSISSEDSSVYCDYCGSKMERIKKRCPSCGARVQKNDKDV